MYSTHTVHTHTNAEMANRFYILGHYFYFYFYFYFYCAAASCGQTTAGITVRSHLLEYLYKCIFWGGSSSSSSRVVPSFVVGIHSP